MPTDDRSPDNTPKENASTGDLVPSGYPVFLTELEERIRTAQVKAALSINRELVLLYWQIMGKGALTECPLAGMHRKIREN